ncbi:hypothetical protein, partial [Bacteroides fragilis]|uniref:hypothetical protein n=1 Tax=Bacteroides fragilis TaxID=817 RepID=UPI000AE53EB9
NYDIFATKTKKCLTGNDRIDYDCHTLEEIGLTLLKNSHSLFFSVFLISQKAYIRSSVSFQVRCRDRQQGIFVS